MSRLAVLIALTIAAVPASAKNWEFWGLDLSWKNRITLGAAWRLEERDSALVGKRNQEVDPCVADDCQSLSGDPEPNQRLVDAPGGFFAHNMDDGNLSYDKYEPISALVKVNSELSINWNDWFFKASAIAFHDDVNNDFEYRHANTLFQPARTPRDESTAELVGESIELYELVVRHPLTVGDLEFDVSVGQQTIRWGEANLVVLNSINEVNPVDARRLRQPGFQVKELFLPVPLAVISGEILPDYGVSAEAFYQFGWRPVIGDPGGSFFGSTDPLYRDDEKRYGTIGLGYQPEDPQRQKRINNPLARMLTETSFTGTFAEDMEPEDGGQYGLKIGWYTDFLNPGTEYGFYAMNYHSRFPYASAFAADRSCLRDAMGTLYTDYLIACQGFPVAGGREPLPVDTLQAVFEYPEDIQMYGFSFNTNVGDWALAGEYSYRPNLPIQIAVPDLVFAALQPAFPAEDIVFAASDLLGIPPVPGEPSITVPSARNAIPDYVETRFRGNQVQGGQYIQGYERMKVDQISVTGIRIFGASNPVARFLRTDQIVNLIEFGATYVRDLPSRHELQFEGGSPNRTHFSPGADGTGSGGVPDTRRQTPTQQREAFVTDFSWGYRILSQLQYNDVWRGINLKPIFVWQHDVQGFAPSPMQNFLEDRMQFTFQLNTEFGASISGKIYYSGFYGSEHFATRDRDNIGLDISYTF